MKACNVQLVDFRISGTLIPMSHTPTDNVVLTESFEKDGLSEDYFFRMMSPQALKLSAPYHKEENAVLEDCLSREPRVAAMNFVAVGAGELWALRQALAYTERYTAIEPLADLYLGDSIKELVGMHDNISVVPKRFGETTPSDLHDGNSFFMFLFNIFAYIENPIADINKLMKPGDILFISTWMQTEAAKAVRKSYFDYLNEAERRVVIVPEDPAGLSKFDAFPFHELKEYKRHERFQGDITDILTIYT